MGLCEHVYRRGGIYWWRKRATACGKLDGRYIHLSLKVRDPKSARLFGRRLSAEAERIAILIGSGALDANQEQQLLRQFISEQIAHLNDKAVMATSETLRDQSGKIIDAVDEHMRVERILSVVFGAVAAGSRAAKLTNDDEKRLLAEGFSSENIYYLKTVLCDAVAYYASFGKELIDPKKGTVGPEYAYFLEKLNVFNIPSTPVNIERARRLWMRAQSQVLKDTDSRYGIDNAEAAAAYKRVRKERRATKVPPSPVQALSSSIDTASPLVAPLTTESQATHKRTKLAGSPPSIGKLCEDLVRSKRQSGEWDIKTATQHERLIELFVKFLGSDNPRDITQAQVRGFRSLLDQLPRTHGKSPRDRAKSIKEIVEAAKKLPSEMIGLSPGTINRYLTQLGTILKFLRSYGHANVDVALVKDMRPRDRSSKEDKRKAFSPENISKLFAHPVWAGCAGKDDRFSKGNVIIKDVLYWVPLLGYYSLGRLSELCGLTHADIDRTSKTPALMIRKNDDRRIKNNEASQRRVPLHPELVRLGFLEYLDAAASSGSELVFSELRELAARSNLANTFDKRWVPLLDSVLPDARKQRKTFHSFRKLGNTAMLNAEVVDAVRNDILGHAQVGVNAAHYKGELQDETKLRAMSHIPIATAHLV